MSVNNDGGNWYKLNERINHVENQVATIGTKVESMQGDITGLINAFNNYVEASNKSEKTNWATIAAWAAVAIACVSALLYHTNLVMEPQTIINQYQQRDIDELRKESHIHATAHSSL